MKKCNLENLKNHPLPIIENANASRDLQINFNQAEDALTIPAELRHDYKCGSATQSGRSMKEMHGVLAINGVLSVGGIAGYSKAMTKYRINKTIEQITLIAGNVRAFWGPQKNYDGVGCSGNSCFASGCSGQSSSDGCPIHKKAKIFPDEMITVTDGKIMSITNPFGGGVYLGAHSKAKIGDNQAFSIEYYDLPQEACIELATYNWTSAGAYAVTLVDTYREKVPVDLSIATEICDEDENGLFFYFDIDVNSEYWQEMLQYDYAHGGY